MKTKHNYARHFYARPICLFLMLAIGLIWQGMASATDTVTYYHTDALGTPVMESNAGGVVTYASEHEPYGERVLGIDENGPGFTGHIADADTGLIYMEMRYYDPNIGRFLSNDPMPTDLDYGGNYNRYWYANNNPYAFIDPDGMQAKADNSRPSEQCGNQPCPPEEKPSRSERHEQRRQERLRNEGWAVSHFDLPSLPQEVVDATAGFGDGVFNAATFGQGDLGGVRDYLGVDGGVNEGSTLYGYAHTAGQIQATAIGGLGVGKVAVRKIFSYTGPLKQWVRFGPSYSRVLGQQIRLSLRWGASPARGGQYLRQIPSETMRRLNQALREKKLPGSSWRTADPGHFHVVK